MLDTGESFKEGDIMDLSLTHRSFYNNTTQEPAFIIYKGDRYASNEITDATYYTMCKLCEYSDYLKNQTLNHIPKAEDSFFNTPNQNIEMKMMDTILFEKDLARNIRRNYSQSPSSLHLDPNHIRINKRKDLKPKRWIFTDLLGNFHYKNIETVSISDVIRAFFVNLNMGK